MHGAGLCPQASGPWLVLSRRHAQGRARGSLQLCRQMGSSHLQGRQQWRALAVCLQSGNGKGIRNSREAALETRR